MKIKSYTVSSGEKLWTIAENLLDENNIDNVDVRELIDTIKCINEAKGINTDVLYHGQSIYIPENIKEVI